MRIRAYTLLVLGCVVACAIQGQTVTGPVPGFQITQKPRQEDPRQAAERAKQMALAELRAAGGRVAAKAEALQSLLPHQFLERLAVSPLVGPSTIAPPNPRRPAPTPSVNVTVGGGATTGHPGVVLLLARDAGQVDFQAQCSGTLIRQNVVLTAAHCVCFSSDVVKNYASGRECVRGTDTRAPSPLMDPQNWRVFFQHVGVRGVTRVVVNEGYRFDRDAVRDDLALLVLDKPVTEINPPALPQAANPASAWSSGRIIGFGFSSVGGAAGSLLTQLVQPGIKSHGDVTASTCKGQRYLDPATSLCSLFSGSRMGSPSTVCGGDSGGPLWQFDASGSTIGVTSGRSDADCTRPDTVAFQMATSFQVHREWIDRNLQSVAVADVKGRWPTFGDNLLAVVDRRNAVPFSEAGVYESEAWISLNSSMPVLATINSSGPIRDFSVQDRKGKVLCRGVAGTRQHMPNVDYCRAKAEAGTQFRIVAKGQGNEFLQYVVTTNAVMHKP